MEKEIRCSGSPEEALQLLETFKPTLVMLDIEMPGMSGFDFLNRAIGINFDVIFTTAYNQYAIKAIRFSALDYLLKPIDSVELQNAINRHIIKQQNPGAGSAAGGNQGLLVHNLINNLQQKDSNLFKLAVSTTEGIFFFAPGEIIRLEGENNYTRFIFSERKPMVVSKTLKEYDDLLRDHGFIRVHKSYVINRQYIVSVDKEGFIKMKDGSDIEISRRRKEEVMGVLMNK